MSSDMLQKTAAFAPKPVAASGASKKREDKLEDEDEVLMQSVSQQIDLSVKQKTPKIEEPKSIGSSAMASDSIKEAGCIVQTNVICMSIESSQTKSKEFEAAANSH